MKFNNILAGLAGAVALNILHESLKKTNYDTPRVDLLGEEALQKTAKKIGMPIDDEKTLYKATLAGDILSNTLYYSMIANGKSKNIWIRAITFGLAAGVGAVNLPQPLGLDSEPVAATKQRQLLTVGYYLFGALVTGFFVNLKRKS